MLAAPFDEAIIRNYLETVGPLFMSPKLDGIRCGVREGVAYGGRSGKPIKNKYIQSMLGTGNYNGLDGELIVGEPSGENVYKNTYSGVSSIEGSPLFTYWLFDQFMTPNESYLERYKSLYTFGCARVLPQVMVSTWEDVLDFEEDLLAQGFEGGMLRRPGAPYKFGRATPKSLDLTKLKREEDVDVKIDSCYEAFENQNEATTNALGHTERSTHKENLVGKNTLGGFWVMYNGELTKCAPGKLDHKERQEIWDRWVANPDSVRGEYLKMRHFPYGADKKPRFPRAQEFITLGFRDKVDMDPDAS